VPAVPHRTSLAATEGSGEQLVASDPIEAEIDRALMLAAADRLEEAQQALIAVLQRGPDNPRALNELGLLLVRSGAIAAACRVFAEAIARHPQLAAAHVNLAGLLLRANDHATARLHYDTALGLDPDNALAHQGLGAILSDAGDPAAAAVHFRKGFRGHAVSRQPFRGTGTPLALLHLVSAGAGNVPTATIIDDRVFQSVVMVVDCVDPAEPLPPHQLVFNAIGDADRCAGALAAADALLRRTPAPVINPPAAVLRTGRVDIARRFNGRAGVVAPRTVRMARAALAGPAAAAALERLGLALPLLLRSPGCHTGRNFVRVDTMDDLAAAVAGLPGEELLAIEFLDARGHDGCARKYRVMMIGGALYPLHLAISRQWKVHYFTADMAERPDHRAEEAAFLDDMHAVLGAKAMRALREIRDALGLDYCGIDFGLGPDGDVLVFEANATMVICPPDSDPRWAYRRAPIARAAAAVTSMMRQRLSRF
jgi:tetratricopeptide (TPR) repeat protein